MGRYQLSRKDGTPGDRDASSRWMQREATIEEAVAIQRVVPTHFEDFYRSAYGEVARALILTLGDRSLGIEATDEAMARAYRDWRSVARYGNPQGWVYRVGLNWGRSFMRKKRRELLGVYRDQSVESASGADPALDKALAELDTKHRSVVVMRYYLDWSNEEIAKALRVPEGTVKSRLHRALAQLGSQEKGLE